MKEISMSVSQLRTVFQFRSVTQLRSLAQLGTIFQLRSVTQLKVTSPTKDDVYLVESRKSQTALLSLALNWLIMRSLSVAGVLPSRPVSNPTKSTPKSTTGTKITAVMIIKIVSKFSFSFLRNKPHILGEEYNNNKI